MAFFWLVVWPALAVIIGFWANSRGRNGWLFFFVSLLLSPLLASLILLLSADLSKEQERREAEDRKHERHLEEIRALTTASRTEGTTSASLADELQKLADLKEKGVLTDAEFRQQKERLLGL